MNITATFFDTAIEAVEFAAAGTGEAVMIDGGPAVVPQADCDRMAAAGVSFAYLHHCSRGDGRQTIVSVPIN